MAVLQEYKCPCCGGAIEFDSNIQKMRCPYCDTEFEMEALAQYDSELKYEAPDHMQWENAGATPWQEKGIRSYICNSCGGEIIGDENTAATACPYCGNPVVMMEQFAGTLRPDLVIPFQLDKADAIAALKQHYEGKRLLPKAFKDENHLQEIQGIYVPFWLFDTEADANVRYRATQVRHWSDSRYDYTETSHYLLSRRGNLGFERIPVDGSSKMDDTMMESIEPFDHSKAVDFQTAYLAGYLADKYDVESQQCIERANQRVRKSTEDAFAATTIGYTTVVPEHTGIQLKDGRIHYALYPVWLLSTKWQGKNYLFAMNGQTGKMAGDLPVDKSLARKWFWGITAAVSAAAMLLSYLLWLS